MTEEGKKKIYGRTMNGPDITDELIERYVAEAEAGYDLDKWLQLHQPTHSGRYLLR